MSKIDEALGTKPKPSSNGKAHARTSPAAAAAPAKKAGEPLAYFDSTRGQFWTKDSRGEWIQFSESSLRRILRYKEYADVSDKDLQFARIDCHLMALQQEHNVAYAGAIAGYKTGIHVICGQRVLVTSGPRLLRPAAGEWSQFRTFVEELLRENVRVFYGWMKAALRSLYAGPTFRPGQMMAIAGPAGCGKSLLQNLITEMFGGRSAKPYRYLTGQTAFNADLLQNEHLMIEDEAASTDQRIRRAFGSQLKNLIVNEVQSLHRKGRDALSVTPFTRVTITLNDEPEELAVLPPLDESLIDKITLLRAFPFVPPYAPDDITARNTWRRNLSGELPAFMHWLRSYRIPDKWVNVRYGVSAFHDPVLVREVENLSAEVKLLTLIDVLQIWGVDREPWEGSADELEERLLEKDKLGRVQRLLYFPNACARYLAKLLRRNPDRITVKDDHRTAKLYTIAPLVK